MAETTPTTVGSSSNPALPPIPADHATILAIDDGPFVLVTVELWLSPDDALDLSLRVIGAVARIRKLDVGDEQQSRPSRATENFAGRQRDGAARRRHGREIARCTRGGKRCPIATQFATQLHGTARYEPG